MRMTLRVQKKFYYDIGLRGNDTYSKKLARTFGEDHPKYLEDFIEFHGKHNITVISYGDLTNKKDLIDKMLT